MAGVLAGIPYTTFPEIGLGPIQLRTFGLMVGLGVVLGAWLAAIVIERAVGVSRDDTYSLATRMVVAGVIGARLTWAVSHFDQIETPIDVIAVWKGGLQFSGGFIAAIIVGFPTFRHWNREVRWKSLDGYAYGLTIGLAIGRIGCYAVGEHFGSVTNFFLGTTYKGGETREGLAGTSFETARQLEAEGVGVTFHNTSLYEFMYLLALFAFTSWLLWLRKKPVRAGTITGIFCLYYGVARFGSDLLRVNDETVLGLTGAQFMSLVLLPAGAWILFKVRPDLDTVLDLSGTTVRADAGSIDEAAADELDEDDETASREIDDPDPDPPPDSSADYPDIRQP